MKHAFEINKEQSDAWDKQIHDLQTRLEACGMEGDIIFEYDIVRLGKRIDVILLIKHMVFSLEFKKNVRVYKVSGEDGMQRVRNRRVKGLNLELAAGDAVFLRLQDAQEEAYLVEYALRK